MYVYMSVHLLCLFVCVFVCMYICVCACLYFRPWVFGTLCNFIQMCILCMCMCVGGYACVCVCVCVCVHLYNLYFGYYLCGIHLHLYVCLCVCVCVCVCLHATLLAIDTCRSSCVHYVDFCVLVFSSSSRSKRAVRPSVPHKEFALTSLK